MDILNTVKSALGGGDKNNDLMSVVMNLVGGHKGGLNGFNQSVHIKRFGRCWSEAEVVDWDSENGAGFALDPLTGTVALSHYSPRRPQPALRILERLP